MWSYLPQPTNNRIAKPPSAIPPKNSSSHRPANSFGKARLNKKHRGVPPIAATSLTARARHFQPTESAGCLSRRKCVPSRNQSHVKTTSRPRAGRNNAASSPIPSDNKRTSDRLMEASNPFRPALARKRSYNSFENIVLACFHFCPRIRLITPSNSSTAALKTCPSVQGTVFCNLFHDQINTGLTLAPPRL